MEKLDRVHPPLAPKPVILDMYLDPETLRVMTAAKGVFYLETRSGPHIPRDFRSFFADPLTLTIEGHFVLKPWAAV
jgi:hypothetical protein